jgi:hypothetical protein
VKSDLDTKLKGVMADVLRRREECAVEEQQPVQKPTAASATETPQQTTETPQKSVPRTRQTVMSREDRQSRLSTFQDDKKKSNEKEIAEALSGADLMIDLARDDRVQKGETKEREIDNKGEDLRLDRVRRERARKAAASIVLSPTHHIKMPSGLGAQPPPGIPQTSPLFYPLWSDRKTVDKIIEQQNVDRVEAERAHFEGMAAARQAEESTALYAYRDRLIEEQASMDRRSEEAAMKRKDLGDGHDDDGPKREIPRDDGIRMSEDRRSQDSRSLRVFEERRLEERRIEDSRTLRMNEERRTSEDLSTRTQQERLLEEERLRREQGELRSKETSSGELTASQRFAEEQAARIMQERLIEEQRLEQIRAQERMEAERLDRERGY